MLKSILRNWHRYVLWAVLSVIFWSWIVIRVTDAPPKSKVTVYVDLTAIDSQSLTEQFDDMLPDGIRMVEFDRFDAMIFQPTNVLSGDLYLIPESKIDEYIASFLPIDTSAFPGETFYERGGQAYGVCVYDPALGKAAADACILYPGDERCYLFFNRDSRHVGSNEKAFDNAAYPVAVRFLEMG